MVKVTNPEGLTDEALLTAWEIVLDAMTANNRAVLFEVFYGLYREFGFRWPF